MVIKEKTKNRNISNLPLRNSENNTNNGDNLYLFNNPFRSHPPENSFRSEESIEINTNHASASDRVNKLLKEYGLTDAYSKAINELKKGGLDVDASASDRVINKDVAAFVSKLDCNSATIFFISMYEDEICRRRY